MSAPLYFLPGVYRQHLLAGERFNHSLLAARGLETIFGDVEDVRAECALNEITAAGPGGRSGTMIVPLVPGAEPPARLGYAPEFQEWQPVGEHLYWLGLERDDPPTPAELRRKRLIGGYAAELGDGGRWVIPILRRPDGGTEFPTSYGRDAAGQITTTVRPAYRDLWEETAEVIDWFLSGSLKQVAREELPRVLDWCVRILAVNYRFDWALQNRMGAFGSEDWFTILWYAVDGPAYLEINTAQKKTDPSIPTTSSSPLAAALATSTVGPAEEAVTPRATANCSP